MNFRSGASKTSASIGSVPAGAEVDVLGSVNDWDLVRYNGQTEGKTIFPNSEFMSKEIEIKFIIENNFNVE